MLITVSSNIVLVALIAWMIHLVMDNVKKYKRTQDRLKGIDTSDLGVLSIRHAMQFSDLSYYKTKAILYSSIAVVLVVVAVVMYFINGGIN